MQLFGFDMLLRYTILITFFNALLFLNKKNKNNLLLILIILVSVITEIVAVFLLSIKGSLLLLYSISFFFHQGIWLCLILTASKQILKAKIILPIFIAFAVINYTFIEKNDLNYLTFIFAALIYIVVFLRECWTRIKTGHFDMLSSNYFLLIFIPFLFFVGFSFIFSFKNSSVRDVIVFNNIDLYSFIGSVVNIIYYALINIYIYRERTKIND